MCKIREATTEDLEAMIDMGERFFAFSRFSGFAGFDRQAARDSVSGLMAADVGVVLVAVVDGRVVGVIIGALAPLWFSKAQLSATELAWWVDEGHRGGMAGVKLLRAFEQWATDRGATIVSMSDLVIGGVSPAGRLFEKLGYTVIERSHVRKVN